MRRGPLRGRDLRPLPGHLWPGLHLLRERGLLPVGRRVRRGQRLPRVPLALGHWSALRQRGVRAILRTGVAARNGKDGRPVVADIDPARSIPMIRQHCTHTRHHELLEERLHLLRAIRRPVVEPPVDQGEKRACQVVGDDLGWYPERTGAGSKR